MRHLTTLSLDDPRARDSRRVGLAAAWLATLRAAGAPVRPASVVMMTEAPALPEPGAVVASSRQPAHPPEQLDAALEALLRTRRGLELLASTVDGGESLRCTCAPERAALLDALTRALASAPSPRTVLLRVEATPQRQGRVWRATPGKARVPVLCIAVDGAGELYRTLDGEALSGSTAKTGLEVDTVERIGQALWQASALLPGPLRLHWSMCRGVLSLEWVDCAVPAAVDVEHLGAEAAGLELWSSFMLREHLPQALTPLSLDLWRRHLLPVVLSTLTGLPERATRERRMLPVDRVDGRLYWNINRLAGIPAGRLLLRLALHLDRSAGGRLLQLLEERHLEGVPLAGLRKLWSLWHGGVRLLRLAGRVLRGLAVQRALSALQVRAEAQRAAAGLDLTGLDDRELLWHVDETVGQARAALGPALDLEIVAALTQRLASALWPRHPRVDLGRVWAAASGAPSADVVVRCRQLGALLRQQRPELAWSDLAQVAAALDDEPALREAWQGLLRRHGHRCADEQDLSAPRWCDDAAPLLRAIGRCAEAGVPALSTLAVPTEWPKLSRWLCQTAAMRDWPGWSIAAILAHLRALLLEVSRRLVERQLLERVDDTWMADLETLQDLLLGRRRDPLPVRARIDRAASQHAWQSRRQPPDLVRSDGVPVPATELEELGRGVPASPGLVEGPLRVVEDAASADVRAFEIVALRAFSAGCAPLLAPAAGLITEAGDASSLAAVSARALGLPAVVALGDSLRRLRSGQRVRVDGDSGLVTVL